MTIARRWTVPTVMIAMVLLLTAVAAAPAAARGHRDRSISPVTWFTEPDRPIGVSLLTRTDDGVHMRLLTSELGPQEAITTWWIVFNNPQGCSDPCSADDIFLNGDASLGLDLDAIAASDAVGGYATGSLTNAHGWVMMADKLGEGELGDEVIFGTPPLLKDAQAADVHLVTRTHGPAVPGLVDDQLGSYGGGCDVFFLPATYPTGVGGCSDIQTSIHSP